MRSMGAKVRIKPNPRKLKPMEKDRSAQEVLAEIGGAGTVVKINKKHGS